MNFSGGSADDHEGIDGIHGIDAFGKGDGDGGGGLTEVPILEGFVPTTGGEEALAVDV